MFGPPGSDELLRGEELGGLGAAVAFVLDDRPGLPGRAAGEAHHLGGRPGQAGLASAATEVVSFAKRPPRQAGTVVKDEGDGGVKAAEFLAAQKFI